MYKVLESVARKTDSALSARATALIWCRVGRRDRHVNHCEKTEQGLNQPSILLQVSVESH